MFVLSLAVAAMLLDAPPIRSDTVSYTARQLADELPSLLALDSSQFGFSVTIDTVGAKGSLGALSRANWHYVLYLTLNAPAASLETLDRSGSRAVVKERALRQLAADTTFLRVLRESVQNFRVSRGEGTNGARAVLPRRIVAVQRLQDVAARFFYPDAILPNGRIQSHVCVGINGVVDLQGGRDLALEAFAYAAIFHDILSPEYYVDADFQEASRLINAMDLSSDPARRLVRAQGVMWGVMVRSEKLRQVLTAEYQRVHTFMPFEIRGMPSDRREAARL